MHVYLKAGPRPVSRLWLPPRNGVRLPSGSSGVLTIGTSLKPQIDLCRALTPRLLEHVSGSALSDTSCATVVSDIAFVLNFESCMD